MAMEGIFVRGLKEPETCSECPFKSLLEPIAVESNLFKYISKCSLAPDEIEDPWRDIAWQLENKESFCPICNADKALASL